MKILIVEDDQWIAELLRQVLESLTSGAELNLVGTVGKALNEIKANPQDLLLCDLNLPDGSGLEVIEACRRRNPNSHRVLITSQIDRATVIAARRAGITSFIAKPFKVESLLERLRELVNQGAIECAASVDGVSDLQDFLTQQLQQKLFVPWSAQVAQSRVLNLERTCSRHEMVRLARQQPILLAGLMHQANRDQGGEGTFNCVSVEQAIDQLGLVSSIELAIQLARTGPVLRDPLLLEKALQLMKQQAALAKALTRLAHHQSIASEPVRSAVSLCLLGEMATLCAIQNFVDYGQQFDPQDVDRLMLKFAPEFGNRIKVGLKLPFITRELIGAVFKLPQNSLRKDLVIMRIAALETELDDDPIELARLRKWVGLSKG